MDKCTKNGIVLMFTMVILAVGTVVAQDLPPRTQVAHYIPDYEGLQPPIIDGILDDEAWTYSSQGSGYSQALINWLVKFRPDFDRDDPRQSGVLEGDDEPVDDTDLSYRVWIMYDDEYLYVSVAVLDLELGQKLSPSEEDGATWNEDSVEIFIDGNHNAVEGNVNDHPEEYESGGQFVLTSLGARRDKEAGDPSFGEGPDDEWYASVFDNDTYDGYNYEFRIKLSKIGNPEKGDTIGFNIAVNDLDDNDSDTSDYQLRWTGLAHDESTYGDLYFGRREVTAPLITEAITIDGKLDESSWSQGGHDMVSGFTGASNQDNMVLPRDLADLSYDFYVIHDESFLYVAVDVNDDLVKTDTEPAGSVDGNTWHDDSVEVFLDGDYSRNQGANAGMGLGGQLVMTANGAQRGQGDLLFGEDFDWFAAPSETDDGYIVEFRFDKEAMFPTVDTELIGFNIAVNEDDNDEVADDRDGQLMWDGPAHREASYGALIMGGPPVPVQMWDLY